MSYLAQQHDWVYAVASAVTAGSILLYYLYRYLLPKPIPGIPYNLEASKSLLGDIPRIQKEAGNNIFEPSSSHSAPPTVVVTDFREGQDILMRRKEFERSDFSIAILSGEAPKFHISLKTGPEWKAHRRLLQDLMNPKFLHEAAAPNIYKSAIRLLSLWKMKAQIARGRPFNAELDIFYAALDAVFDFGFGDAVEMRALTPQIENVARLDAAYLQASSNDVDEKALEFPCAPVDPSFEAMLKAVDNITPIASSGFPSIAWWFIGWKPSVRKNRALIDKFLKDQLTKAAERVNVEGAYASDDHVRSAVELMMQREATSAKKEGRESVFWNRAMRDETFGFIVAGHDTTSTTLCWGVKFLSDNRISQRKLRKILREAHSVAVAESRAPSHAEIIQSSIPYLDAVVEEMLRLAHTAPVQDRQATEDTVVLGHRIPKGTTILVPNMGASFTEPAFEIPEDIRSASCQTAARERGTRAWNHDGMNEFRPERWLVGKPEGRDEFDLAAGPTLPFGLGLRGCFGRKLAYMELKLLTTLIVWTFELLPCPEGLSSYEAVEGLTRKPTQCYVSLKIA
ncbi:Cytochrome P450 monooxygenase TRI13 [Paramyrothecium foliicola]|nr:Cytochrome P450 monooxygenase TRI13 [Paramyrothecium foliicola]